MATKMTSADDKKSELRKNIASKIEQLQAAYDAEMLKFMDLQRRIAEATKLGRGDAETAFLERELDVVQRDRRDIGEKISQEMQELRDVDGPTLEDEYGLHLASLKDKAKPPKKLKLVPPTAFKNNQIDLFRDFLVNTNEERDRQSNAIDFWDNVPRYSISRVKQASMRLEGGFLPLAELEFQYKNQSFTAQIRPARIEARDKNGTLTGKTFEYYPSAREELVEHALRKLAAEQYFGFLDESNFRSGVTFTLHQLRTELARRGHAMKYADLVESLDVMNLANIRLLDKSSNKKNPSLVSQAYLPSLVKVNKDDHAADPEAKWLVQFHSALTASITQLTYRQFNYQRLMNCQSQLARWLIGQLVLKYTYAAPGNAFTMLYSTIYRDSALLDNYKRTRDAVGALDDAFAELKREGVLMSITKAAQTASRGKIVDVAYKLAASVKFSSEQKAANKRLNNSIPVSRPSVDNLQ